MKKYVERVTNVRIESKVYKQLKLLKVSGDHKSVSALLEDMVNREIARLGSENGR